MLLIGPQAVKAQLREERRARWADRAEKLRPVGPLLLVTGFAGYGQVDYFYGAVTNPAWIWVGRLLVAVGIATAFESISLYVQWLAHDLLLRKASASAARTRRASYLIAGVAATVQFWHFSNGWSPTPSAVVFALFSAAGPWLWGMHTRRAQHMQLIREGYADSEGAVFSAKRFRMFPWRTLMAARWSVDHGVADPREAWAGYAAYRAERKAARKAEGPRAGGVLADLTTWVGVRDDSVRTGGLRSPEPPREVAASAQAGEPVTASPSTVVSPQSPPVPVRTQDSTGGDASPTKGERPAAYEQAVRYSAESNAGAKTLMRDFGLSEHYAKEARKEALSRAGA